MKSDTNNTHPKQASTNEYKHQPVFQACQLSYIHSLSSSVLNKNHRIFPLEVTLGAFTLRDPLSASLVNAHSSTTRCSLSSSSLESLGEAKPTKMAELMTQDSTPIASTVGVESHEGERQPREGQSENLKPSFESKHQGEHDSSDYSLSNNSLETITLTSYDVPTETVEVPKTQEPKPIKRVPSCFLDGAVILPKDLPKILNLSKKNAVTLGDESSTPSEDSSTDYELTAEYEARLFDSFIQLEEDYL